MDNGRNKNLKKNNFNLSETLKRLMQETIRLREQVTTLFAGTLQKNENEASF